MEHVEVGMFRLPGLAFKKGQISPELNEEMVKWAQAEGVGMSMTDRLWSFRKESHREWFIIRWIDRIPKMDDDEDE
jgi:sigma54-dependent transcription regulator